MRGKKEETRFYGRSISLTIRIKSTQPPHDKTFKIIISHGLVMHIYHPNYTENNIHIDMKVTHSNHIYYFG